MSAGDARARISAGPGGQGANVAVRLARTGVQVRLIAPLADDPAGRVLRGHFEGERVEVTALPASRTSMVVVLVAPGGERSMLSDREPVQGGIAAPLAGCDWVHVSGYVLREPGEAERVVTAIRASGVDHVSVAGGSFEGSADAGVARDAIAAIGAGLVVMNRDEAGLLAGESMRTAEEAVQALATSERLAVVTDGARGSAAAGASIGKTLSHGASATKRQSVDTTGAGDAFTAALLAALAPGWPPDAEAVSSALEESARAGAMATTVIGAQSVVEPDAAELSR
jgi:sugar/nucleoside kinase (ribokinase family)